MSSFTINPRLKNKTEIERLLNELEDLENEKSDLEEQIEEIDDQISSIENKIEAYEKLKKETGLDLDFIDLYREKLISKGSFLAFYELIEQYPECKKILEDYIYLSREGNKRKAA